MTDAISRLSAGPLTGALRTAPPRGLGWWTPRLLLGLYTGFVLFVTLIPDLGALGVSTTADSLLATANGSGAWLSFASLEVAANIAMFVPLGLLLGFTVTRHSVWPAIGLLPAFSAAIETTQVLLLPNRIADIGDVVANGTGGWIGLLVAVMCRAIAWRSVTGADVRSGRRSPR